MGRIHVFAGTTSGVHPSSLVPFGLKPVAFRVVPTSAPFHFESPATMAAEFSVADECSSGHGVEERIVDQGAFTSAKLRL